MKDYSIEIIKELKELFSPNDKYYPITSPNGKLSPDSVFGVGENISEAKYFVNHDYLCVCYNGNMWINGFFAHNITRNGKEPHKQEISYDKLIPNMFYTFNYKDKLYTYKNIKSNSEIVNIFDNDTRQSGFVNSEDIKSLLFMPPESEFIRSFNKYQKIDFKLSINKTYSII
jgi:hypothetical protein